MSFVLFLSQAIVPILIFYIVATALMRKKNVYDEFLTGAKRISGNVYRDARKMPVLLQVPDRAAPTLHRQAVFILRCDGASAGSVQGIWDGLLHRTCGITSAEQHGDDLLHDVRVFYVGADQKNALYIGGCAACNIGGNCGKRMDRDLFIEKYINEIEKIGKTVYRIWCAELRELQGNGAIRV